MDELQLEADAADERPDYARDLNEFELRCEAFSDGGEIPVRHTADGDELSPALAWGPPPPGARSLVLIADDPDAPSGTYTHWLIVDLAPTAGDLVEGRGRDPSDVVGARALTNDAGTVGWTPPDPPPGRPHRYRFRLLALDRELSLPEDSRRAELDRAIAGKVIAEALLVATYGA